MGTIIWAKLWNCWLVCQPFSFLNDISANIIWISEILKQQLAPRFWCKFEKKLKWIISPCYRSCTLLWTRQAWDSWSTGIAGAWASAGQTPQSWTGTAGLDGWPPQEQTRSHLAANGKITSISYHYTERSKGKRYITQGLVVTHLKIRDTLRFYWEIRQPLKLSLQVLLD